MNRANLTKRLLFAAWAIPLGWLIINVNVPLIPNAVAGKIFVAGHTEVFLGHVCAVLLVFLAASEYLRMLSISFPKNGFWLVYIWLGLQMGSYFVPKMSASTRMDLFLLFMLVAAEAVIWGKRSGRWRRASLLFSGTAFLSISGLYMLAYYDRDFQQVFASRFSSPFASQMGIVTVCSAIFLCDTTAYFVGSLIGKTRLSSISPRKTIEGSVAGFITATVVCALGWQFLATQKSHETYGLAIGGLAFGIVLGMLIGVFGQIGDLVVSLMKRYFRVKDASDLIPGHGGVLDRFDSLFFTAPVVHLFVYIVIQIVS
jgi:phosphatidate cytidylyltransferase